VIFELSIGHSKLAAQYSTFTLTFGLVFEPPLPSMRIGGLFSQPERSIAPAPAAASRAIALRRDIGHFSIPEIYSRSWE
jgi:hypothetical protein